MSKRDIDKVPAEKTAESISTMLRWPRRTGSRSFIARLAAAERSLQTQLGLDFRVEVVNGTQHKTGIHDLHSDDATIARQYMARHFLLSTFECAHEANFKTLLLTPIPGGFAASLQETVDEVLNGARHSRGGSFGEFGGANSRSIKPDFRDIFCNFLSELTSERVIELYMMALSLSTHLVGGTGTQEIASTAGPLTDEQRLQLFLSRNIDGSNWDLPLTHDERQNLVSVLGSVQDAMDKLASITTRQLAALRRVGWNPLIEIVAAYRANTFVRKEFVPILRNFPRAVDCDPKRIVHSAALHCRQAAFVMADLAGVLFPDKSELIVESMQVTKIETLKPVTRTNVKPVRAWNNKEGKSAETWGVVVPSTPDGWTELWKMPLKSVLMDADSPTKATFLLLGWVLSNAVQRDDFAIRQRPEIRSITMQLFTAFLLGEFFRLQQTHIKQQKRRYLRQQCLTMAQAILRDPRVDIPDRVPTESVSEGPSGSISESDELTRWLNDVIDHLGPKTVAE